MIAKSNTNEEVRILLEKVIKNIKKENAMGNRASLENVKFKAVEYGIHSVVSTRVESMDMLKITHNYFNCSDRLDKKIGWI